MKEERRRKIKDKRKRIEKGKKRNTRVAAVRHIHFLRTLVFAIFAFLKMQ